MNGFIKHLSMWLSIAFLVLGTIACTQNDASSSSGDEQTEGASGKPTGVISVPDEQGEGEEDVKQESGAVVASDVAGSYLYLPQGVEPAGPSVHISPKDGSNVDQKQAQQVRVTIALEQGLSLAVRDSTYLVIMYQIYNAQGETVYGLIPRKDLEVEDGSVSFLLRGFGNYQPAILPELVTEERESDAISVPVLTGEQVQSLAPLVIEKPTGSFISASRSLQVTSPHLPSSAILVRCIAVVDEDKSLPYDHFRGDLNAPGYTTSSLKDTAHSLYAFFECVDSLGRQARSSWSSEIVIPVIDPPTWSAMPTRYHAIVGNSVVIPLTAEHSDSFSLVSSSSDCDTVVSWIQSPHIDAGVLKGIPSVAGEHCTITLAATNVGGTTPHVLAITSWADPGNLCDIESGGVCTVNSVKVMPDGSMFKFDGDLVVASGGSLTAGVDDAVGLDVSGLVDIKSGGSIHANVERLHANQLVIRAGGVVSADGLSSYTGETTGSLYVAGASGQGAPHGGNGGPGESANTALAYGLASQPNTRGAQGENGTAGSGGAGGGAIRMMVTSSLVVEGTIRANGADGAPGDSAGGGGSGGSLWLEADSFSGSGTIAADGGAGGNGSSAAGGAGGAGGRVAIYAQTSSFVGALSVSGGTGGSGTPAGQAAQDGTTISLSLTDSPRQLMFVTSTTYDGALGGVGGADSICRARASAAGMSGEWIALLGANQVTVKTRATVSGSVYDRSDSVIAEDWNDLWAQSLQSSLSIDEFGAANGNYAWTGSQIDGSKSPNHCASWTSSSSGFLGGFGDPASLNGDWLNSGSSSCDQLRSIYCLYY